MSLSTPNLTEVGSPTSNDIGQMLQKKPRPYKKRRRLSNQETKFLMDSFDRNPKPNSKMRAKLAIAIPGMSERTIQIWFQNRRAKVKQGVKEGVILPGAAVVVGGTAEPDVGTGSLRFTQTHRPSPLSLPAGPSSPTPQTLPHLQQQQQQQSFSPGRSSPLGLGSTAVISPREHVPQYATDYRQNYFRFSVNPNPQGKQSPIPSPKGAHPASQLPNPSLPHNFTPLDHLVSATQPPMGQPMILAMAPQTAIPGLGLPLPAPAQFYQIPGAAGLAFVPSAASPAFLMSRSQSDPQFGQLLNPGPFSPHGQPPTQLPSLAVGQFSHQQPPHAGDQMDTEPSAPAPAALATSASSSSNSEKGKSSMSIQFMLE